MQPLSEIKTLLRESGLAPRKSLGQNFLIDHNLIARLLDAAEVGAAEGPSPRPPDPSPPRRVPLVLEVGPGTGAMTEELLSRGCEVVAAELDHGLCDLLRSRLGSNPRFTLIEGDCLASKSCLSDALVGALDRRPFRLVSNLPYGAGTGVLLALLTRHPECDRMGVTIQREVAQRLAAAPGTPEYGSISVVAQCVATLRHLATLPPECFWPRPDVTSAMVVLDRREHPLTADAAGLADFCKRAFAGRRKQLRGLLRSMGVSAELPEGIAPDARIEDLAPPQIAELHRCARGAAE